jgi:hypothetical protein
MNKAVFIGSMGQLMEFERFKVLKREVKKF